MLVVMFVCGRAEAHAIGLSNGTYAVEDNRTVVRAELTFARGEVRELVPGIDANGDGHLTDVEVLDARKALEDKVLGGVRVRAGSEVCRPTLTNAALTEQDGLAVSGRFECSANAGQEAPAIDIDLTLLDDLARGHRHLAHVSDAAAASRDEVLYRDQRSFRMNVKNQVSSAAPASAFSAASGAWAFFRMGVEHILTGYDHLVFLFGLVLLRARVRQLLAVITAFTAAHSITLALATLGVLTPSPRIIEPAIALSIAYVGIENFFVKDGAKRWRLTFLFGLVHGFGFAGALREIDLPSSAVPTALVTFNLGVEAGQLAVMAFVLPLVSVLRDRQRWFDPAGVRILSGAVALAGGIWFFTRVAFGV